MIKAQGSGKRPIGTGADVFSEHGKILGICVHRHQVAVAKRGEAGSDKRDQHHQDRCQEAVKQLPFCFCSQSELIFRIDVVERRSVLQLNRYPTVFAINVVYTILQQLVNLYSEDANVLKKSRSNLVK